MKLPAKMNVAPGSVRMFARSGQYVAFTGVCNMNTGVIHLAPVNPRKAKLEFNVGQWNAKTKEHEIKAGAEGWETEEYEPLTDKELEILDTFEPIGHSPKGGLGTSHEQLAKDVSGIGRGAGQGKKMDRLPPFVGFSIVKGEGSKVWPHQVYFCSGTFNRKFTKLQMAAIETAFSSGSAAVAQIQRMAPKVWGEKIRLALQEKLPMCEIFTKSRR